MMKEAVDDLGTTLAEAASAAGAVGGMVDSINDAINKMEETPTLEPEGTFVDYQTTMVKTAKAIAVTVQEMVSTGRREGDCPGGTVLKGRGTSRTKRICLKCSDWSGRGVCLLPGLTSCEDENQL